MIKEYVIHYKTFGMAWFYEFKCYAETTEDAIKQFVKAEPIGIETFKIVRVVDI